MTKNTGEWPVVYTVEVKLPTVYWWRNFYCSGTCNTAANTAATELFAVNRNSALHVVHGVLRQAEWPAAWLH